MSDKDLVGVKGWLLFLVLSLSVFSVILGLVSLGQFELAEFQYPDLSSVNEWKSFKHQVYTLVFLSLCMRIFSAYRLYYYHEESSVKFAKLVILTTGPVFSTIILILGYNSFNEYSINIVFKDTIPSFIAALIWILYLNKSIRVKNTYYYGGENSNNKYSERILHMDPVEQSYLKTINNFTHSIPEENFDMPAQIQKQDSVKHSGFKMKDNEHSEALNEDELYLQATKEVDEGNQDQALWAKCMALCEGDERKAKYKYIKERVEKIYSDYKSRQAYLESIITKKIDFYFESENLHELNMLLKDNNIIYQFNNNRYTIINQNNETIVFKNTEEFMMYLRKIIPSLKGF